MPVIDLPLGSLFGDAVTGLNLAYEDFLVALHFRRIVISELAPLLLNFAFELFPVSGNLGSV